MEQVSWLAHFEDAPPKGTAGFRAHTVPVFAARCFESRARRLTYEVVRILKPPARDRAVIFLWTPIPPDLFRKAHLIYILASPPSFPESWFRGIEAPVQVPS
jgi:hypothetical protein